MIISLVSCASKQPKNVKSVTLEQGNEIQIKTEVETEKRTSILKEKDFHQRLYTESENRFDYYSKITSDPSTTKKIFTSAVGDNETSTTLYYKQNRMFSVVYRQLNSRNEKIFNRVFDFDENNKCISSSTWIKSNPIQFTTAIFGDSLIRFDFKYNKINLSTFQKQEIIRSTKSSLDSLMQHFPEFNYSINWE